MVAVVVPVVFAVALLRVWGYASLMIILADLPVALAVLFWEFFIIRDDLRVFPALRASAAFGFRNLGPVLLMLGKLIVFTLACLLVSLPLAMASLGTVGSVALSVLLPVLVYQMQAGLLAAKTAPVPATASAAPANE